MHEGLWFTRAKGAELLTAPLSFPVSLSRRWTRAPLKPCSSGPFPNCRALGGLLFIAVKALTPYCAVVSGWIQHRALLCRLQLFHAWVGWLGGSGSGHIFSDWSGWPDCFCLLHVSESIFLLAIFMFNEIKDSPSSYWTSTFQSANEL